MNKQGQIEYMFAAFVSALATEIVKQLEPRLAEAKAVKPYAATVQQALFTVKQAGVYLGRSEQSVQHLIFEKHLPVVRAGRRVHLRRIDLDNWIENNTY